MEKELKEIRASIKQTFVDHLQSDAFEWTDDYNFVGENDGCDFRGRIETVNNSNYRDSIIRYLADDIEDFENRSELLTLTELIWRLFDLFHFE